MSSSVSRARRRVQCVAIAGASLTPAAAALAAAPTYNSSQSYWHVTHNPGGPGGSTNQILNQALQNGTPTNTYNHTETFKVGGTTKAKAGVGRTQSSTGNRGPSTVQRSTTAARSCGTTIS